MASPEAVAALRRLADRPGEIVMEHEALAVVAALGIDVPRHAVVADAAAAQDLDLAAFPGDRVVVKALGVAHKTEVGGVVTVARTAPAVAGAVEAMASRPPGGGAGFLVEEHVAVDPGPGGELLAGMRWSDEFGPVVSFGPGGVHAELLSSLAEDVVAFVSPQTGDVGRALGRSAVTALVTEGQRGAPPRLEAGTLGDVVERLLALAAAAMPHLLAEIEINPLALSGGRLVALDALLRPGPTGAAAAPPRPLDKLSRLLEPRSLAVVGVSAQMNPGHRIVVNAVEAGYPTDRITVVKPGLADVEGCRAVPDLGSLGPVDLLIVSVAAEQVPGLVEEAIALRCAEAIVLIPGGLGEREGSEAVAARLTAAIHGARDTLWRGPLVNGGNCLGLRSRPGRYDTFFVPRHKLSPATSGTHPVAFVSQSGALALASLDRLPWLQPEYVVSLGNQVDLTAADYLGHFADAPEVEVVASYIEGFRPGDGRRWLEAATRLAGRGGAPVLYRAGRTPAGAGAAASHTAAIAGDYRVTRALAAQSGALVADTLEDFDDLLMLATLLHDREVRGRSVGVVSNAGFETVAAADRLGPLTLARFAPATNAALERLLATAGVAGIVAVHNPLDVTPVAGDRAFAAAAAAVLDDPHVDVAVVGCVPFTEALDTLAAGPGHHEDVAAPGAVAAGLLRLAQPGHKAWVAVVAAGHGYDPLAARLLDGGVPVFRSADRATRLLGQYCAWRRTRLRTPGTPPARAL